MLEENNLGWFHIEETWNLHVDGNLRKREVYCICVDEAAEGDGYIVDHYDRAGDRITSLRLEADDIRPEVEGREPIERPMHV